VKRWFAYRSDAAPVPLDDALPGPARPLTVADRACCCPGRPVVTAVIPPGPGHPLPEGLLLCGHHYRVSCAALLAVGAEIYDKTGTRIAAAEGEPSAVGRKRVAAAA
jgi:hypothetical protein